MKREIPRDSEGRQLCEHCMETPVPASLGTKPRRYCSRNCRQRAYESRRAAQTIRTAVAFAVDLDRQSRDQGTSRDVPNARAATSRDDEKAQVAAPATSRDDAEDQTLPLDPGDEWVRSPEEVDAQLRALEARRSKRS